MRNAAVLFVMVGLVTLTACEPVVSVHPIFTESDLVTDARLLGCWTSDSEESACMLTFTQDTEDLDGNDKSYSLAMMEDDGTTSAFRAHLTKLGDHLFLDIQPVRGEESDTMHTFHMAAMHTFYRVRVEGETLRLAWVANDWLDEALTEGDVALPHRRGSEDSDGELVEHSIVLTATTEQLQRFVLKFVDDNDAFTELGPFYRGKADSQKGE